MEDYRIGGRVFREYISEKTILDRVAALAAQISKDYEGKDLLVVPVLCGAFIFASDLVRALSIPSEINFTRVSTYGNAMQSDRRVKGWIPPDTPLKDRHVLIVEDIVDSGFSASFLMEQFLKEDPASVKLVSLLFKSEAFESTYAPDYLGFEIPPEFVVGYGLDCAQKGRELRGIYKLAAK